MYHKIHPFNMNNLVVLSIFTRLCNHHHCIIAEYIHHPENNCSHPLAFTLHFSLLLAPEN